jgi:glycosyltransferase involved in cell wall biosynthesis
MSGARDLTFVTSADYARRTGGWIYDARLLEGLAAIGWRIGRTTLPAGFPEPSALAREHAAAQFRSIADGSLVLVDQLCLGVLPEVADAEGRRLSLVMIVHHPLALEGYHADRTKARLRHSEQEVLRHVAAVIVTSPTTARLLITDYAVPRERIIIAVPGVDRLPLARGSGGPILNLISVGAVVPRKNHELLIGALAGLRRWPWRLTVIGNVERAAEHVGRVRGTIASSGLAGRVRLAGELPADRLARLWAGADLCVSASRHEGYGMALAEALAHGVPVVSTYAGAAGAWIGRGEAKIVPGGRVAPLRAALRAVIGQASLRAALRRGAVAHRRSLPTWQATAIAVDAALTQLADGRSYPMRTAGQACAGPL